MERVTASDPSSLEFKFSFSPGHKQEKSSLVFIMCKGKLNKNDNMKNKTMDYKNRDMEIPDVLGR